MHTCAAPALLHNDELFPKLTLHNESLRFLINMQITHLITGINYLCKKNMYIIDCAHNLNVIIHTNEKIII